MISRRCEPKVQYDRAVIINADDFGLSQGVNRGILEAFRHGVLTSTTAMVNMDSFGDAAEIARRNRDLPVGIHLTLLWGRPVSSPEDVRSLVMHDRSFPTSAAVLAARYGAGLISFNDVRTEFRNQIKTFLDAGLTPTHVDSHKHIHALPGILKALISVLREFRIQKIRFPLESGGRIRRRRHAPPSRRLWRSIGKRVIIQCLCRANRGRLGRSGLTTTDHFAGMDAMNRLDEESLGAMIDTLRPGITEIMCHAGHMDKEASRYSSHQPDRETELSALTSARVRERVEANGIRLTNYRDWIQAGNAEFQV